MMTVVAVASTSVNFSEKIAYGVEMLSKKTAKPLLEA